MEVTKMINNITVRDREVCIIWLGQSGFLIKSSKYVITIDPYLSNCCERLYGFKRFSPSFINANTYKTDILFISHKHEDHFDIDSIPLLYKNLKKVLISPPSVIKKCKELGFEEEKLISIFENKIIELEGISFKGIMADHGELCPDAVGVLIKIGNIKIYYSGDTAYSMEIVKEIKEEKPDVAILPINGMYGNLNGEEAAKLAEEIGASVVIPSHFWTFKEHNGYKGGPDSFENAFKELKLVCIPKFLTPGEVYFYKK